MPAATNLLLGVLLGKFYTESKVDHIWWSHIGTPLTALKSKVTAVQRAEAESFYRTMSKAPVNFDYFLIVACALIFVSFFGGMMTKPLKRAVHTISLVLFTVAVLVELFLTRPLLNQLYAVKAKKVNELVGILYYIAMYHAASALCVLITTLIQVSSDEQHEEEEDEDDKVKED